MDFLSFLIRVVCLCLALLSSTALVQLPPPVTESGLFPYGVANGDSSLPTGNDVTSAPIVLDKGMLFFEKLYTTIFVNENGLLSFVNPVNDHSDQQHNFPVGDLPNGDKRILIAPFFANVDTTDSGQIFYRQSTEKDLMERCDRAVHQYFIEKTPFQTEFMLIVTWSNVSYYGSTNGVNGPLNTFQVVLAAGEFDSFAFFRYETIEWTTGVESGGSPSTGMGGDAAKMGFNAGDDDSYYREYRYNGHSDELVKLPDNSNNDEIGMFIYHITHLSTKYPMCRDIGPVRTYPHFDSMLGHSILLLAGPCFNPTTNYSLYFGDVDAPLAIQSCTYHTRWVSYCFTPIFFEVGRRQIRLSLDSGMSWSFDGLIDIANIGDLPPTVTRIDPDGEGWLRAGQPITIKWDQELINSSQVSIGVLAYSEAVQPEWEELYMVLVNNTGQHTWTPQPASGVNDRNGIGVIRVTQPSKIEERALWSDLHFLGYVMNADFQTNPANYSNQRCQEFHAREKADGSDVELLKDLRPCPCNLTMVLADRGHYEPDGTLCRMDAEMCRTANVLQCFVDIIPSLTGHESTCCYDDGGSLVFAGDSTSGSFSRWISVEGLPPYNQPGKVPSLSSGLADFVPRMMCCVLGDRCDYYQDVRPTVDCRAYQPVRAATAFGDPHFLTFDGTEYTFNGKGEYTLSMTTLSTGTDFEVQGRFEQVTDANGKKQNATIMTAVGTAADGSSKITVQMTDRTVMELYVGTDLMELDGRTILEENNFYVTFPLGYEKGNLTQAIVVFVRSQIAVVVSGSVEMLTAQVLLPATFLDGSEGLLGTYDNNQTNDLRSRSGEMYSTANSSELFKEFGQSWLINSADSLFHYSGAHSADYFYDPDFVPDFVAPNGDALPPGELQQVCEGNLYCEFDLNTTGNARLAGMTMRAYKQHMGANEAFTSSPEPRCSYLPTPVHGEKIFLGPENYGPGSLIKFLCKEGYIFLGQSLRACNETAQWSDGSKPTCIEVKCGTLLPPDRGTMEVEENRGVITANFTCDEGYTLRGTATRTCGADAKWTGQEATCEEIIPSTEPSATPELSWPPVSITTRGETTVHQTTNAKPYESDHTAVIVVCSILGAILLGLLLAGGVYFFLFKKRSKSLQVTGPEDSLYHHNDTIPLGDSRYANLGFRDQEAPPNTEKGNQDAPPNTGKGDQDDEFFVEVLDQVTGKGKKKEEESDSESD